MYQFDSEKMNIIIPVRNIAEILAPVLPLIPPEFRMKREFHITLIGYARGREINAEIAHLNKDRLRIIYELRELLETVQLMTYPIGRYYRIEKEVRFATAKPEFRKTIIALLEIPHLEEFWQKLEEILGMHIPMIFPHVTLATYGEGSERAWEGIGIKDKEDFEQLTKHLIL
jgi:hypothetical protein